MKIQSGDIVRFLPEIGTNHCWLSRINFFENNWYFVYFAEFNDDKDYCAYLLNDNSSARFYKVGVEYLRKIL